MKRLTIAAAAVALAACFAGAAQAQGYPGVRFDPIGPRLDRIDERIERGEHRGDLTRREAALLRRDLNVVAHLEQRYAYNGFSRWEVEDLQRRVDNLARRVRFERRDPEGYDRRYDGDRYDRRDRDDRYDGYGGYDQYGRHDRDDRYDRRY